MSHHPVISSGPEVEQHKPAGGYMEVFIYNPTKRNGRGWSSQGAFKGSRVKSTEPDVHVLVQVGLGRVEQV